MSYSTPIYPTRFGVDPPAPTVPAPEPEKQVIRRLKVTSTKIVNGPGADLPTATMGVPVPFFVGRQRITNPNILWYGGLSTIRKKEVDVDSVSVTNPDGSITITDKETITWTTVGYRVNCQIGIGLGPEVKLLSVYADDEKIWSGAVGPLRTEFTIDSDGFVTGGAVFQGGNFDQAVDPYLAGLIDDCPAYVGVAYVILKNLRSDRIGDQLSFEALRLPNPLGLDLIDNVSGDDLNCASAMVELITSKWGGAGVEYSKIDEDSFTNAAYLFKAEGNFCSFYLRSRQKATDILAILQDQTNSIIFTNPSTGKIEIVPVRKANYSPATAPRINFSHITSGGLREFNKTAWNSVIEAMGATYVSRDSEYESEPVYIQTVSSSETRGRKAVMLDYPTVYSKELAGELLKRDFAEAKEPTFRCTIDTDRFHADRLPGDICELNIPKYNLYNVPVVVSRVRRHPIDTNTVSLEVSKLTMNDVVPVLAAPPNVYKPDLEPVPGDAVDPTPPGAWNMLQFRDAPYFMLKRKGVSGYQTAKNAIVKQFALLTPKPALSAGYSMSYTGFMVWVDDEPGIPFFGSGWKLVIPFGYKSPRDYVIYWGSIGGQAAFPTAGKIETAVDWSVGLTDGIIPSIIIEGALLWHVEENIDGTAADVRAATHYVMINDEILGYEDFTSLGDGRYELTNVHRGLLDTVAQTHNINSVVYIVDNGLSYIAAAYPLDVNDTRDITWKMGGTVFNKGGSTPQPISSTILPYDWVPTRNRGGSPLRPHDTMIEGVRSPSPQILTIGDSTVTITWKTRNRDTNTISLQNDAAELGEVVAGFHQVHRVWIKDSTNTDYDCGATSSAADANTLDITVPAAAEGFGTLWVESEILIDGVTYKSQFKDTLPILIAGASLRVTHDNFRVTTAGDKREVA